MDKEEIPAAARTLIDAYQDDPIWNDVFSDQDYMNSKLFSFLEVPLRYCRKYGCVYATSNQLEGAAVWLPGEVADITFWRTLKSGAI